MAKPKPKHPGGRPSRYNKEFHPKLVAALAALGRTDEEMSEVLGITRSTFYKWKKEKPEFSDAIKAGKAEPNDAVEASLFQRALGYSHPEEKIFLDKSGEIVRAETRKHYPPDTAAAFIWLKNRRPEKWRDKQEIDVNNTGGAIVQIVMPDNGRGPGNVDGDG